MRGETRRRGHDARIARHKLLYAACRRRGEIDAGNDARRLVERSGEVVEPADDARPRIVEFEPPCLGLPAASSVASSGRRWANAYVWGIHVARSSPRSNLPSAWARNLSALPRSPGYASSSAVGLTA